jgi:hypothetical protein
LWLARCLPWIWLCGRTQVGRGTLELAERLVELDDACDCIEDSDMTEHDVDADVMVEARRIMLEAHVPLGR